MESYKDTIVGCLVKTGTADLLLHILKFWRGCEVNEGNQTLPVVLYFSAMMYTYYSRFGFTLIKHNEEGGGINM